MTSRVPAEAAPPSHASLYDLGVAPVAGDRARPEAAAPCLVCGAREVVSRFETERGSRLVVCVDCGLGRVDPMPGPDEVRAFYPDAYYGDLGTKFRRPVEWLVRAIGARHVRFLAAGLEPGARVLDVGCGRGVLLGELAARGFETHGVEMSEAARRGADARAHIRVADTLAEAAYPDAHFAAVIIWHVLEHLPDPAATLAEAQRVLRPGGKLVVAVPNFSSLQARWAGAAWFHLDLPRHLFHFPRAALRRLVEGHGFRVESEHHFSLRQNPFGWVQSWQNRRGLPRNALYSSLYRSDDPAPPYDAALRRRLLAGFCLAAAPALALSVLAALLRSGATVHVVAMRR